MNTGTQFSGPFNCIPSILEVSVHCGPVEVLFKTGACKHHAWGAGYSRPLTGWVIPTGRSFVIVLLRVWQFGSPMVIFFGGPERGAERIFTRQRPIDGAGKWEAVLSNLVPLITPVIFVTW